MKKKFKIFAGIGAFLLISFVLYLANGLVGNPVSKFIAKRTANEYIKENYSNINLDNIEVNYNFKTGDYYVNVKSPTSIDTHFTLTISPFGKLEYDTYEYDVLNKYNTYMRIDSEYSEEVYSIFEDEKFPYKSDIAFGEIIEKSTLKDMYDENVVPLYGINTKDLELDKEYDIKEISKNAGHIVLYIEDNTITPKRASEILLNVKDVLDKENINFYAIDFILEKPRKEDGTPNEDNSSIRVEHFLYKDIYEENLDKRIENSYKNLMKYYNEQDLKKEEMDL